VVSSDRGTTDTRGTYGSRTEALWKLVAIIAQARPHDRLRVISSSVDGSAWKSLDKREQSA